jgi:hypothetical protein
MKLNATYSLAAGTVLTPGYLTPTFDILSDDSSTLTSSSSIQNSASSATYSGADAGHKASVEAGIIMDLGSLKTVSTVKLNCKFQMNYGIGTISVNTTLYSVPGFNSTDPGASSATLRFVPGKSSIYDLLGSLVYILKGINTDNSTGCSTLYAGAIGDVETSFTNKVFGGAVSAVYRVQYGVTNTAFFDLENTTVTTPISGLVVNKTINIPSSVGSLRYLKLIFSGYAINKNTLTLLPTTSNTSNRNTLIGGVVTFPSYVSALSAGLVVTGAINITSTVDTIYTNRNLNFSNFSDPTLGGSQYTLLRVEYSASSSTGPWTTIPITSSTSTYQRTINPLSSGFIRLVFNDYGGYSYGTFGTYFGLALSGSKCAVGTLPTSNLSTTSTSESIVDGNILLYDFYADDGAVPSFITISNNTPSSTTSNNGMVTLSVTASVSVTSGTPAATLTYQWQKKEVGASSFVNIANATSPSLTLTSLTNAADNGDQYLVIVSANGASSVTSNTTTLSVPSAPVAYSLSSLINGTSALLYNNQINEGQTLLINVTASKAPETFSSQALTLYWKRIGSGTSATDIDFITAVPGGIVNMSPVGSSQTPQSFTGQLSLNTKEDNLTEGTEGFIVVFYDDINYSNEIIRTSLFTILDTSTGGVAPVESQTPTPPVTPTPTKPQPSSTKDDQGCFIVPVKVALSQTPTRTQTGTPTTTPTSTPPVTPPNTPLATNTPTRTKTPFPTATPTNNPTNTPRLSQTPTNTPTNTITPTNTKTPTQTPTNTPTTTLTPSTTTTPTLSPSVSLTPTRTPTTTPSGPLCEGPLIPIVVCPPCNSTLIIGYNEFIDPRCGLYRIPIYECVYIPNCGQ